MTPDRLTEAEVAEVENRARYYRDIGKVERDFCATIRETVCLLAERAALREALAELESATTMWTSRRSISNPLTNALARARALLAPQKESP